MVDFIPSLEDLDTTVNLSVPQDNQPQQLRRNPYVAMRRSDGIIHLTLYPEIFYTDMHPSIPNNKTALMVFLATLNQNDAVEVYIPGISGFELGRSENSSRTHSFSSSAIGFLHTTAKRAKLTGVIDSQYENTASFAVLALTNWLVSPVGEIIFARPTEWKTSSSVKEYAYFTDEVLLPSALAKGYITETDITAYNEGKIVRVTYDQLKERSSNYQTLQFI